MKEVQVNSVMLVDDNDTDNFIHKRVIELTGFAKNIIVKNSGKSALEFLESNKSNLDALPDLIFLDINMPIVDGFVFLFEYENFPDPVKDKCKIVILSSSDSKRDIDRIVDNEYVINFITKPLSEEALDDLKTIL
ncbi:MAG: response regulator [Sporocytophaga sp.]|jgi:CheY-like chemotaxis protein|uniref:Two-component response regulator n=1 Tax=Sporocytophaga myxococcoides TaxID=153721 RepID=A0A098L8R2_9BACT|nr:response regulator [Sporocytophaga myxococcoides]MCR6638529.1 response regulator [Sporocytophaga sp.]GAL82882.1 two-component response regulator [Sporocytophaga myxococcoides]